MSRMSTFTMALLMFSLLVGLVGTIYEGFEEGYGIVKGEVKTIDETHRSGNIIDQMYNTTIVNAVQDISKAIAKLKNPLNPIDVGGALITGGIGIGKLITGLIVFPIQMLHIIGEFYHIPTVVIIFFDVSIGAFLAFLLISLYSRWEM